MLALLFWLFVLASLYSYFIYPLLLWWRVRGQPASVYAAAGEAVQAADGGLPRLSLIITAHNEAARIRAKLDNALAVEYPREHLEILVASDCSTDDTDAIVAEYAGQGVKLARADQRLGKEYAQLCAIKVASGDILVFSDVATEMPADALTRLVRYFDDPQVGAVSSEDRFISQAGKVGGEGLYVRYEMWLRRLESGAAGLVGLSGSFFAARRTVCEDWDIQSPSDFNTALNCARQGLRGVTAPDVLGYYRDLKDPAREYQRKVRTVLRGMTGLGRHPEVLNWREYGWFAHQVIGHKLLRWLVPWALAGVFLCNLGLLGHGGFYTLTFWAQLLFYGTALAAHLRPALQAIGPVRIIYFFVQVNVAIAQAGVQYLSGKRMTVWQPSAR